MGHRGNEAADAEAKRGADTASLLATDLPSTPEVAIKSKFKHAFRQMWQDYWSHRPDCRQTKIWLPTINRRKSFELLRASRKKLSVLVQIITGHNFLKRHQALVDEDDDNECRLCLEDEETSFHILAECPALAAQRLNVFGTPFLKQTSLEWTPQEIASFLRAADIGPLFDPTEVLGPGLHE